MGLKNNDTNYRILAGADIDENAAVYVDSNGYAQPAQSDTVGLAARGIQGICPQPVKSGEPVPVIRAGKVDGLTVAGTPAAGDFIYLAADGTWRDTPEASGYTAPVMIVPAGANVTAGQVEAFILANPTVQLAAKAAHIADLPVDFTDDGGAKDLDTDAKRVAAQNATNTAVNAVVAALEAVGILKTS